MDRTNSNSGKMKKPRPKCLVCGKPISAVNCGFPKKPVIVFDVDAMEKALEERLRAKGIII